jgi:SAM-dependent methyltransferase
MRAVSAVRSTLRAHWFDWRYHVKTCGDRDPRQLSVVGENVSHAIPYIPTTPRTGRHILRNLPVTDVSSYTFIDIGSGKGRMLLLAAEFPFRRVIGIEFASDSHALAQQNVKTYRNPNQACFQSDETCPLDTVEVGVDVVDILVNTLLQRRHLAEMCFALLAGSHQKLCIAVRLQRLERGHRETLLHFRNT